MFLNYLINPSEYVKSKEGANKLSKWAKRVYIKHNYTCFRCGYKAGGSLKIEAHHIYPKSKYPRKAFDISNGICLCEECHRTAKDSYHTMYGVNGSQKQFKEWLLRTSSKYRIEHNTNKIALLVLGVTIIGIIISGISVVILIGGKI
jgi:hypothetical protein